ncbi:MULTISPECIES: hypothetical protein [Cupriavidus]|uniref:hypothetical protein n=1 Tax=Cupriavidus TaxID=106589 RepID=UPI0011F043F0|nr:MULTISPECIES: hypothetical protein [Cupriavidus]MWL91889.1 hypothetical protein [Cupriavidus sp. SW-Y-13]
MVNPIYPHTSLDAMQLITFKYANGFSMMAELLPKPRVGGATITQVDVEITSARWSNVVQHSLPTLVQAGTQAFLDAQADAAQSTTHIAEIRITGEEFVTKHDMLTISGNTVPVTVV